MEERRKHPRTDINEPALVSAGGSVQSCVVRNISAEGAAIDVENAAFVPARFVRARAESRIRVTRRARSDRCEIIATADAFRGGKLCAASSSNSPA